VKRKTQQTTAPRAAIYCRKSVARGLDRDVNSLTVQREACEAYCAAQGWTVLPTRYEDGGFTGRNLLRPGFQALMRDAMAGKLDRVVVYKLELDRASRSLTDFVKTIEELETLGIGFVSVTQQFDTVSPLGRLTMGILASFAAFESDVNSQRTMDAIAAARRKGKWTGGQTPAGYDIVDGRLVPHEADAFVIRELFATYLRLGSAKRTARHLNDGSWLTKGGSPWNQNRVLHALRNPVYVGRIALEAGGETVEGEHEALVDQQTWDRVQEMLADHEGRQGTSSMSREFLLGGLVRCGCGSAMVAGSARGRGKKRYVYYSCRRHAADGAEVCTQRPVPADKLDAFVVDRIREVTGDGQLAEDVAMRLAQRIEGERTVLAERSARLTGQLGKDATLRAKLVDALADLDAAGRKVTQGRIADLDQRLGTLEVERDEADQRLAALEHVEANADFVAQALADFHTVWDVLSQENRWRLVHAIVERVIVNEPANIIEAHLVDLGADADVEAAS
jgi:DNA invertase Pin-like site-specific DNA recombinase